MIHCKYLSNFRLKMKARVQNFLEAINIGSILNIPSAYAIEIKKDDTLVNDSNEDKTNDSNHRRRL